MRNWLGSGTYRRAQRYCLMIDGDEWDGFDVLMGVILMDCLRTNQASSIVELIRLIDYYQGRCREGPGLSYLTRYEMRRVL